jgi:hypothetical protein
MRGAALLIEPTTIADLRGIVSSGITLSSTELGSLRWFARRD